MNDHGSEQLHLILVSILTSNPRIELVESVSKSLIAKMRTKKIFGEMSVTFDHIGP